MWWTAEKQGRGGFLLVLGLKISSSILAPLAISLPFYEFKTAIRAWPNHTQWKKLNYHDDFFYTSLFITPFFLVWFWGLVFGLFLFSYNKIFMHCIVKSTPTVSIPPVHADTCCSSSCICPTTLHPSELPSPQVTCTTGCLSTWQMEHAVLNKNPWRSKQAFLLTWQRFRLNRKTYLELVFHYLALLKHLGKR